MKKSEIQEATPFFKVVPPPLGVDLSYGLVYLDWFENDHYDAQRLIAAAYGTEATDDITVFVVPYFSSLQSGRLDNIDLGLAYSNSTAGFLGTDARYVNCAFVTARPWVSFPNLGTLDSDQKFRTTLFAHEIGHLVADENHQSHKSNLMLDGRESALDRNTYNGAVRLDKRQELIIRNHRALRGGTP